MPHVVFAPFTGFRIRERDLLELGMSLPALRRRGRAIAELPALGPLTLAGMLPEHWTAGYVAVELATDDVLEAIISQSPTLVAISALTASVEEAYRLSQKLRKRRIQTVIGGLHATACSREAQNYCDAVVIGDGESNWPDVLRDAQNGELRCEYTSTGALALDESPIPRFDLLGKRPSRWTLQTQRGCPLACEFCGASRLLGRFREKPTSQILRELDAIKAVDDNPLIELADDNTFAGGRDPGGWLDALGDAGARWFTETDWRIGGRPDLLSRLAQSGCVQVLVGIESLVFRYPGMGQKQAELDRMMDAVTAIQEAGVAVNGCFIVGAEGETRQSIDRLCEFINDSPLAEVQLTLQTPFPGTALHRHLDRQGRLLKDRGWSSYTLFDVTYQPDILSVAELEQAFRDAIGEVFSPAAAAKRETIRREVWHRNRALRWTVTDPQTSGILDV